MGKYAEEACRLFLDGANCSQAVTAAFSDVLKLDKDLCLRLSSCFGGGMGRLREVCGAVSGMLIVAGALKGYAEHDDQRKAETYKLVQEMAEKFKEKHGSIICRELLGLLPQEKPSYMPTKRDESFYKKRPCMKFIETAALIAEELAANEEETR